MNNKNFYNAEEAMEILGMTKTTFYDEVNAGNIPYVIDKGRKRGKKFPKEAIHIHAQLLKKGDDIHRAFERATNADLWTAIEYDRELYGDDDTINYKKALEWKEKNNEIFMMMKEGKGTIPHLFHSEMGTCSQSPVRYEKLVCYKRYSRRGNSSQKTRLPTH